MLIPYKKIDTDKRDAVRRLEQKGHVSYIRYLMLKRMPISDINKELTRLSISIGTPEQYKSYFEGVLYPLILKYKLKKYYRRYQSSFSDEPIRIKETFGTNDIDRTFFCLLVRETETEQFFQDEIKQVYGANVPLAPDGNPIFDVKKKSGDVLPVLMHEKRHIVDGMLADGYSPKTISDQLRDKYDMELPATVISDYAKSFMNFQRKEIETMIEDLTNERDTLERQLEAVKVDTNLMVGERVVMIGTLKNQINFINGKLSNMKSAHNSSSFSQGVLEYTHIREMFADVMERTYRRYKQIDRRTEDEVVKPLNTLVGMMSKATEKIVAIDTAMSETSKKSITEEMLEVIVPTLDRIEEEERAARSSYMELYAPTEEGEFIEIIGEEE